MEFGRPESFRSHINQPTVIIDNAALQAMIAAAVADYYRQNPPVRGPPGPPGPQGPQPEVDGPAPGQPRWNTADAGFFDPMYDDKSSTTGSSIEHVGKDT